MQRLELSDNDLKDRFESISPYTGISTDSYRLALVKTIGLISWHGMAQVPWREVNKIYNGASEVPVNQNQEGDMSFLDTHQGKLALYQAKAIGAAKPLTDMSEGSRVISETTFADFKVNLD